MTVLLHPTGGMDNPLAHDYLLWLTFGWPFETSLVMLRLVYAGLFQRFPKLKILTHHSGAFIPFMAERIKGVNWTLERNSSAKLAEPVLQSLKRFYGDTAVNGYALALEGGHTFFGADHILFGTDYPYVPITPQRDAVVKWDLPSYERAKIMKMNAKRLYGIE